MKNTFYLTETALMVLEVCKFWEKIWKKKKLKME